MRRKPRKPNAPGRSNPVRIPDKSTGSESVSLFFEFTINAIWWNIKVELKYLRSLIERETRDESGFRAVVVDGVAHHDECDLNGRSAS